MKIIIEITGGTVSGVYSDTKDVQVKILDYDLLHAGEIRRQDFRNLELQTDAMHLVNFTHDP